MVDVLTIAFIAVLLGLTVLAGRMWYTQRAKPESDPERRLYARFLVGLAIFWAVAIAGYFGGPLLAGLR